MIQKLKPSTEIVWPLIALAGYLFFISIAPIKSNDFWWHLKIGELIHSNGQIPATNIFAWTLTPDEPYFYSAWLAEYLFFIFYRIGKIEAIMFTRNVVIFLVMIVMMVETHRQTGSWRLSALTVGLGGLIIFSNTAMRPQIFSVLSFTMFLTILNRYRDRQLGARWLLLCPLIMMFWVNIHGAFVLGIILMGIFVIGESIRTGLKRPNNLTWRENGLLVLTGFSVVLSTLINPRGIEIWVYAFNLTTSSDIKDLNVEWQPPTIYGGISETLFFISILVLLVLLIYSNYRPTITEVFLITFFILLAWTATRHVIWYGIVVIPILVRIIQCLPIKNAELTPQYSWVNLVIIIFLFIPVIMVQPWFIEDFPLPDTYWEAVYKGEAIGPLIETSESLRATEYLQENPGGHLYHFSGYASYIIWAIPDQGVFIDARVELFPRNIWDDYHKISKSINYTELLSNYGVDRLMLDRKNQPDLVQAVASDPSWIAEYEDKLTLIFSKIDNH